jgi:hemoglobin/transferrin/lactoferrin receptor protein
VYVRPLVVCSFLLLIATSAFATDLRGRVEDNSGAAIAGANVVVACPNDARTTVSDAAGRFEIQGLPRTRCTVAGSHANFATTMIEVDMTNDRANTRLVLPIQTLDSAVVVTTSGGIRETASDVPSAVSVIGGRELAMRPYQVLPQVLREEPGVVVQQTTAAAGSPIIRGFTGQSNVYLVDGVRLNTSMWRSGPVQYFAWLSPANVDRLELVRGPMSVQYGSDALGGAVNVIPTRPAFSASGVRFGGQLDAMAASSDSSGGVDGTFTVRAPRVALAIGGGRKSVGDLRPGGGKDSHAAVTRFLGIDNAALYDKLPSTGYDHWNTQAIAQARVGATGIVSGFYRSDRQSGISRYDRINGGEGLYRSEITPQEFDLGVLRYEHAALPWVGSLRATFSYNRQLDGTIEQARPLATSAINADETGVTALGYQVQATQRFAGNVVTVGIERFNESIDATRTSQVGSTITPVRPLIPDGTTYSSTGLFAQASSREWFDRVNLRGGVRFNTYNYTTEANAGFAIAAEDVDFDALTFNGAATINLVKGLKAVFSASRGFRAANAADLGSVGVSGGGGFEISPSTAKELGAFIGTTDATDAVSTGVLAGGLKPESELAYEAGLRFANPRVNLSATFFDLELKDAISRRALIFPTNVVGLTISGRTIDRQDAAGRAFIAIDARPIGTRANSSKGRIRGVDVDGIVQFAPRWTARAWFSIANGKDLAANTYIRRMNPPMGGATLSWDAPYRLRVEGTMSFARAQTRLVTGDFTDARIGGRRTNAQIASYFNGTATDLGLVSGGILQATGETLAQVQTRLTGSTTSSAFSNLFAEAPGYVTVGARAMYPLSSRVDLIVIAENLTDKNYRVIGSGVDAAGRNAQVRLRVRF